jgi:hypothetical protein
MSHVLQTIVKNAKNASLRRKNRKKLKDSGLSTPLESENELELVSVASCVSTVEKPGVATPKSSLNMALLDPLTFQEALLEHSPSPKIASLKPEEGSPLPKMVTSKPSQSSLQTISNASQGSYSPSPSLYHSALSATPAESQATSVNATSTFDGYNLMQDSPISSPYTEIEVEIKQPPVPNSIKLVQSCLCVAFVSDWMNQDSSPDEYDDLQPQFLIHRKKSERLSERKLTQSLKRVFSKKRTKPTLNRINNIPEEKRGPFMAFVLDTFGNELQESDLRWIPFNAQVRLLFSATYFGSYY